MARSTFYKLYKKKLYKNTTLLCINNKCCTENRWCTYFIIDLWILIHLSLVTTHIIYGERERGREGEKKENIFYVNLSSSFSYKRGDEMWTRSLSKDCYISTTFYGYAKEFEFKLQYLQVRIHLSIVQSVKVRDLFSLYNSVYTGHAKYPLTWTPMCIYRSVKLT